MPFDKGRQKTGGRKKGGSSQKSAKLIDQLKEHGFNFVKEFALCLKALPEKGNVSPLSTSEFPGTKYAELKSLLPYMAPKLREKDVELVTPDSAAMPPNSAAISDDALLKVLDNGSDKLPNPRKKSPVLPELPPYSSEPSSFTDEQVAPIGEGTIVADQPAGH